MMQQRPNTRSGFTLVELIVVIVVVALAVAIMLVSPSHHFNDPESLRRANCASRLRQIGMGIEQYSMELNQGYPRASAPGEIGIGASSLALLVAGGIGKEFEEGLGQIRNLMVFVCPSSGDKADRGTETWTDFSSAKSISYGYDPGHSPGDGNDVVIAADYSPDGKNSRNHPKYAPVGGQNILFVGDWHVEWSTTPNSGVQDNNIYLDDGPDLPRAQDSIIVR